MNGISCKLFINTGSYATPTWAEVDVLQDVTLSQSKESFKTTIRKYKGINTYKPTTSEVEINGKLLVPDLGTDADGDFAKFQDAWDANEAIEVLAITGGIADTGARGIRGFFSIFKFDEDQSNDNELFKDFTLKPTNVPNTVSTVTATAQAMQSAKVTAGALTYAPWGSKTYA